jgi:hypothetical protein
VFVVIKMAYSAVILFTSLWTVTPGKDLGLQTLKIKLLRKKPEIKRGRNWRME